MMMHYLLQEKEQKVLWNILKWHTYDTTTLQKLHKHKLFYEVPCIHSQNKLSLVCTAP